jgi:hypothetical protein
VAVFAGHPGLVALAVFQASNAQDPQSQKGLTIFINPSKICTNSILPDSSCQVGNESTLLRESLHEYYDYTDPVIQNHFGLTVVSDCTANISDYIAYTVFNQNQNSCGP